MIRDKVKYTEQEREELAKLRKQSGAIDKEMYKALKADDMTTANAKEKELEALSARSLAIRKAAEGRYIESLGGDLEKILAECSDIARVFTKKDFDKYRRPFVKLEEDKRKNGEEIGEGLAALLEKYSDTPEGAARYLFQCFRVQLDALAALDGTGGATEEEAAEKFKAHREHTGRARAIARSRARELYPGGVRYEIMTDLPSTHFVSIGPLINRIFDKEWKYGEEIKYTWSRTKKETRINTAVVTSDKALEIALGRPGTEYERQVSDALCSLALAAAEQNVLPVFDMEMLYSAMPGGNSVPSKASRERVDKILEVFDAAKFHVSLFDEAARIDKETGRPRADALSSDELDFKGKYAPHDRVTAKRDGNVVRDAIILLRQPFPLIYSRATGQFTTYPARFMVIHEITRDAAGKLVMKEETVAMTEQRKAIAGYILRQIAIMNRDYQKARKSLNQHNSRKRKEEKAAAAAGQILHIREKTVDDMRKFEVLTFDAIMSAAGIVNPSRPERKRCRDFIYLVLDNQICYENIAGYTLQPNEKRPTAVKIELFAR